MQSARVQSSLLVLALFLALSAAASPTTAGDTAADPSLARLLAATLGETPLVDDLKALTQEIGGRTTGSPTNLRSVDWALARFEAAGVSAAREAFQMPGLWLEDSAGVRIEGDGVGFEAAAATMPFSTAAPAPGVTAPLLDAGTGSAEDFERLGESAAGAFLLIETQPLTDVAGLFREYNEAFDLERRAVEAGARGVVYMSSRAEGILYRHNSSLRGDEARPMLILERAAGIRALDLLRQGKELSLTAVLDLEIGPAYDSYNVIGEIPGATRPEEVVIVGAHLDSWDLGGGALDNGANVVLLIDIARQMQRLGVRPARTVRFALWNGEEQGLYGSWRYAEAHEEELDRHYAAMSFDIGCGLINGFFTGGRPDVVAVLEEALEPIRGLGPFAVVDAPIVGTDNFDFMMQGVANLVGNHEASTYGPNYHAKSDNFEQCDLRSLRTNAAIVAAVTWGFADNDAPLPRHGREKIERLVEATDLERQMRVFSVWDQWESGVRGRRP